jgi:hypothetical protein
LEGGTLSREKPEPLRGWISVLAPFGAGLAFPLTLLAAYDLAFPMSWYDIPPIIQLLGIILHFVGLWWGAERLKWTLERWAENRGWLTRD